MSRQISLTQLQKKYTGKIIALSKNREQVLASADDSGELLLRLQEKKIKISQVILSGPIQEANRTYVY